MQTPTPYAGGRRNAVMSAVAAAIATIVAFALALPGAAQAHAAELAENIITSARLSSETIHPYQSVELAMEFRLPNNTVHEGDTSTIRLPQGFAFYTAHDFDVNNPDGDTVAHARIDKRTGRLTLTYTKYVERHSDITGTIKASFILDGNHQQQGSRPFVLDVDGHVVPAGSIEVQPLSPDNPDELFAKYGYQVSERTQDMTFVVRVNGRGDQLRNVRVTDRLGSANIEYDRSSFEVLRGDWILDEHGQYDLEQVEDLTGTVKPQFDADGRGYAIDLGDLPGKGVQIQYNVHVNHVPQNNETFHNKATMTAYCLQDQEADSSVLWKTATGEANGYNYTLKVTKKDEDTGKTIAGAAFTVVRNRSHEQVGTITTGEDGTGLLTGLLRDDYTLTETKAPEGYELRHGGIAIPAGEFDMETRDASVTVSNKRTPEQPKPKQPEPEQPSPEQPEPKRPTPEQAPAKPASTANPKAAPTPLAATGSSVHVIIGTAMALAALGAALLAVIQRRRG